MILVTVKEDKMNKCCPCDMCEHIIQKYKVRKVINYYNSDPDTDSDSNTDSNIDYDTE